MSYTVQSCVEFEVLGRKTTQGLLTVLQCEVYYWDYYQILYHLITLNSLACPCQAAEWCIHDIEIYVQQEKTFHLCIGWLTKKRRNFLTHKDLHQDVTPWQRDIVPNYSPRLHSGPQLCWRIVHDHKSPNWHPPQLPNHTVSIMLYTKENSFLVVLWSKEMVQVHSIRMTNS